MNCSAAPLACEFSGVLSSYQKPRYLLKSLNSCPLKEGPLSLYADMGIPRDVNIQFNLGTTVLVLVEGHSPPGLLTYHDNHTLSGAYGAPEVHCYLSPGFGRCSSNPYWLPVMRFCNNLARVTMLYMCFHHSVNAWEPHPGPQIILCFGYPLVHGTGSLLYPSATLVPLSVRCVPPVPYHDQISENRLLLRPQSLLFL